ncbi:unnamed protein product [Trypanosoma congolense IL3000]|uniref:WGS project CAEQ00000000 data, annotated contig 1928 n=1 Tax=Trypanosoma congolense (strain IL3000) TaxID=1068625 RepID=F9WA41_TRYCI|nr:unnamed protein product [Trypanosoma congolense IL3000]
MFCFFPFPNTIHLVHPLSLRLLIYLFVCLRLSFFLFSFFFFWTYFHPSRVLCAVFPINKYIHIVLLPSQRLRAGEKGVMTVRGSSKKEKQKKEGRCQVVHVPTHKHALLLFGFVVIRLVSRLFVCTCSWRRQGVLRSGNGNNDSFFYKKNYCCYYYQEI